MEQQKNSKIQFLAVDIIVGTISSSVNSIVGYPLDFLKTRMQIYGGGIQQISHIIKNEGFSTLYRGISSPLVGSMLTGSLYFSSYEFARRQSTIMTNKSIQEYLPINYIFLCGSYAGVITNIFSVPLELSKIQIQKQYVNKNQRQKSGPFEVLKTIIKEKGLRHIYKGCSLQLARDFIGCGAYFSCYELTLKHFTPDGQTRKNVSSVGMLLAGVSAGLGFWSISYPIDLVKTRIQSEDTNSPKYKKISACVSDIYRLGGIKSFYKGYTITLFRSIIVNVVSLNVYENLHHFGYNLLE